MVPVVRVPGRFQRVGGLYHLLEPPKFAGMIFEVHASEVIWLSPPQDDISILDPVYTSTDLSPKLAQFSPLQ